MDRLLHPTARGRAGVLVWALVLFAAVLAARLISKDASNGLAILFVVPIVMIAIEFGLVAGLCAVATALGLVGVWDLATDQGLGPVGYLTRGLIFLTVAALCAWMAERIRRESEIGDRYFELGNDLLCTADMQGYFVRLNDRWSDVFGWSREELLAQPFIEFVHPDDRERTSAEAAQIVDRDGATASFANRFAVKGGGWRRIEWSSKLDLEHQLIYAAARDVTERHALEESRRTAEERFRVSFQNAAIGMAIVALHDGREGEIVEANEPLAEILGLPREELLGTAGMAAFAHPDELPVLKESMRRLLEGEIPVLHTELRVLRPDGETRWVDMTTSLLHDADGRPVLRLSHMLDIDVRKRSEQRLRHMADHDPLSWLFNRRRFLDELGGELTGHGARHRRGAVLLIDLDNFKQVNDLSGHAMGDEVIKTVALALVRRLRSGDVAGRLGGDEFGVLLRRVSPEEAVLVSHDLLEAVSGALEQIDDEAARRVTMSIGIGLIDGSPSSPGQLIDAADAAMYEAKREGGGRVGLPASRLAGA